APNRQDKHASAALEHQVLSARHRVRPLSSLGLEDAFGFLRRDGWSLWLLCHPAEQHPIIDKEPVRGVQRNSWIGNACAVASFSEHPKRIRHAVTVYAARATTCRALAARLHVSPSAGDRRAARRDLVRANIPRNTARGDAARGDTAPRFTSRIATSRIATSRIDAAPIATSRIATSPIDATRIGP